MIKHKEQRIGIFVDVANMYYSAKNLYQTKVNFGEVLKLAVSDRRLLRAIAYVVRADSPEEQGFFDALENQGFEVRSKDLQVFYGGQKKGDWDVGIAIDAITLAERLDVVVIVSGDGDYVPLIEYLRYNKGCRVEAMGFGRSSSSKLKETADEFIDLADFQDKVLLGNRGSRITRLIRPRGGREQDNAPRHPQKDIKKNGRPSS
ncbi:MAG: NYN domain-containing protein [Patescibacteria group bacterium]|jgi:uncharacterized LabA/DUF88 family protein